MVAPPSPRSFAHVADVPDAHAFTPTAPTIMQLATEVVTAFHETVDVSLAPSAVSIQYTSIGLPDVTQPE
jgi:hypothetical protein